MACRNSPTILCLPGLFRGAKRHKRLGKRHWMATTKTRITLPSASVQGLRKWNRVGALRGYLFVAHITRATRDSLQTNRGGVIFVCGTAQMIEFHV